MGVERMAERASLDLESKEEMLSLNSF